MARTSIIALAVVASFAYAPLAALASDTKPALRFSEVTHLIAKGELRAALEAVESTLKSKPSDPQWRFLQGALLAQSERRAEAIAVFTSLTEDFPNLPEPHNNLAALQAANGHTDLARASLEAAVRADPSYGMAHENLADVHLRLSLDAYQRAVAAGGDVKVLGPRIKQLQQLIEDPRQNVAGTTQR
jgi:Flp pilus assembly protein TadD